MKTLRNIMITFIVFIVVTIVSFCGLYYYNISPIGKSEKGILVVVDYGKGRDEIAKVLVDKGLIRNSSTFKLYLKLNKISNLQAGTYQFTKSMSTKEIVNKLATGDVSKVTTLLTIKEGKNIEAIATLIEQKTKYTSKEYLDVMSDYTYMNELMDKYWFLSDDILDPDIYYPLEGYLFPNTYDIYNLTIKQIIELQLNEMENVLDEYKTDIKSSNYSVHQLLTMASMVELEGTNDDNRKKIASVFYNRLDVPMSLGSDVTAYYAAHKSLSEEITSDELNSDSPYNTRNTSKVGLPIGPICNAGESAIKAAIYPSDSEYLYFVADKNRKVYFHKTSSEQSATIARLKSEGLWYTYD